MNRRKAGSLIVGVAALGYFVTAALHGSGFLMVTKEAAGAAESIARIVPVLWLIFSVDLVLFGLIAVLVVLRSGSASGVILSIVAIGPIGAACLQIRFLGFIPPAALLMGIGILMLVGAAILPREAAAS